MKIQPLFKKTQKPQPSFGGYNFKLKRLYKQGKLPTVQYDIGGNKLSLRNLSGDHAIPKSKGGKVTDNNMMLATKQFNNLRGNRDLKEVVTIENLTKWANQYLCLKPIEGFDFVAYVQNIFKVLGRS